MKSFKVNRSRLIGSSARKGFRPGLYKLLVSAVISVIVIAALVCNPVSLSFIGNCLILDHHPEKADLIVCLGGNNIERALAGADAYKAGIAPFIYIKTGSF